MSRFVLVCLALVLLLSSSQALAQVAAPTPTPIPTAVPRGTIISLPQNNETVRGRVRIWGSAWVEDFVRYEVRYQIGSADSVYMAGGSQPVINGLLYEWNTAGFKDGPYGIVVRSVRRDGNYQETRISVRVDNTTPPTPTATPTEAATPTAEPTRTQLPIPASTPLTVRTATPTPTVPARSEGLLANLPSFSLDPFLCIRPLAMGATGAVLFFGLMGVLALVRRLFVR